MTLPSQHAYRHTPHPRSSCKLWWRVALKSQRKLIIINVFNKIIEENPEMLHSEMCNIVNALYIVLTESYKLGENGNFSMPRKSQKNEEKS